MVEAGPYKFAQGRSKSAQGQNQVEAPYISIV